MIVCGDGPLRDPLIARLTELGIIDATELRGHIPLREGLLDLYRASHVFLHVSRTEGFPQVLIEAFASGVPVVATAVGGIPAEVGDAAVLVKPEDPPAAAEAVRRVASEPGLRSDLVSAGFGKAHEHTMEIELRRVVEFLSP
jgi:glycosyltransferase involved in cell wall biosynthesis